MIQQLYRLSLFLYPIRFRQDFGEEMLDTFALSLKEARRCGQSALFVLLLREMLHYPSSLLHEYGTPIARTLTSIFAHRPVLAAVLGYALGFACFSAREFFPDRSLTVDLLIFFLCGWLGGSLLSYSISNINRPRWWLPTLNGFSYLVAVVVSNEVMNRFFPNLLESPPQGLRVYLCFLYPLLIGLLLGACLALWNARPRYMLYGTFGSLAGFFVSRLVAALLDSYLSPVLWPLPFLLQISTLVILPGILHGVILGAFLGIAGRDHPRPAAFYPQPA